MRPTESYSAVLVEEGGPLSRLQDVREVLKTQGLFRSRSTDRGSHDWLTVGGTVDTSRPTQGPRAWQQLGGRAVRTLQDRLPQERARAGITERATANPSLPTRFLPAFIPWIGTHLAALLCVHEERGVAPLCQDRCRTRFSKSGGER